MSTSSEYTVWGKLKSFMEGTLLNTITEIYTLLPDSILFGSLLMYFVTQNISFGIFGIFIFETVLTHKMISWVSSQASGSSRSVDVKCRTGYKISQFNPQRIFSHDPYPSYSIFSITSIATYLGFATRYFSDTLNTMGSEWASRSSVAYIFIGLLLLTFIGTRAWSCDSMGEIFTAFILALISGTIFFYINKAVFGEEAMNFLGLPYIVDKNKEGSPIYICAAEK